MITLAVDAMGGDAGLAVTIPGALLFLRQQTDVRLLMVGNEVQVRQALEAANAPMDRIQIVHAAQVVEMDEQPQSALKNKKDSSMRIAVNQVKEGLAQAAVSAGNTGALMATARFVLKTIQGIERPAIAKFIPSQNGHMTLVLDLGANVDCTPEQLVQFAVIGSELVHALYPNAGAPRVGLLNVEGGSIFSGDVDVVVADGFVGNIVLKTIEGAVRFMGSAIKQEFQANLLTKLGALAAMPALKGFKNKLDPRKFNGAIFLGLRGVVIKSHGGTDAVGFSYALEEAFHEAKADSLTRIQQGVADQLAHLADKKLEVEQAAINID